MYQFHRGQFYSYLIYFGANLEEHKYLNSFCGGLLVVRWSIRDHETSEDLLPVNTNAFEKNARKITQFTHELNIKSISTRLEPKTISNGWFACCHGMALVNGADGCGMFCGGQGKACLLQMHLHGDNNKHIVNNENIYSRE